MWSRHQALRVVVCTGVPPKHRGVFARVPRSTETDLLGVAERVGTLEPPPGESDEQLWFENCCSRKGSLCE